MRNYENLVIVKPTLTAEEIQASVKEIEEIITSNGGEIQATSPMGMRKLAYPIEKNERGYYHVIYSSIAPSAISEIERRFRINEDLLRFVLLNTIQIVKKLHLTVWLKKQKKQQKLQLKLKHQQLKKLL